MSLLVFNSSNRIAQGVIRRLYGSGAYERIVCADIYPNHSAISRFLNFKADLKNTTSNTQITDIKVVERADLVSAVSSASHVLYITHDYYSLVPSKLNLIKTVAELAKKHKNVQKLVALTPIEHDHYNEKQPAEAARTSEKEAQQINSNLVQLKSDLTFGPDSTLAHEIITRLINKQALGLNSHASAKFIHSDNVAEVVEKALRDDSHTGKSYLLQGQESVSLREYVHTLEQYTGEVQGGDILHGLIAKNILNIISERFHDPTYMNLIRLFDQYKQPTSDGFEGIENFGISLNNFGSAYPQKGAKIEAYKSEESGLERGIKNFLL